jgi:hypothetical protein
MMSSIESELFYLAEFSDSVVDIRGQFPILPPNYTQRVASILGIKHPIHSKKRWLYPVAIQLKVEFLNQNVHNESVPGVPPQ